MAVVILHVHKYEKNVTRKFKSGGLTREACSSDLETGEPCQHSLVDTGKPRKTCVEVAGRRTFRILTSSQHCFINLLGPEFYI